MKHFKEKKRKIVKSVYASFKRNFPKLDKRLPKSVKIFAGGGGC